MRQADYPRGLNRARINNLFNGFPPFSEAEVEENEIEVNINELSGPVAAHDARSQFYSAVMKPGQFFTARTDAGPRHKRQEYGVIASTQAAKLMKRCIRYIECFRSKFALNVLHGIAPSGWRDPDRWCPEAYGIEDVMVPANTLLAMENLPFVPIYKQFTAPELIKLTRGPRRDPAWNMDLVNACIEWVDSQTMSLVGSNWPEIWAPEKQEERVKSDGGFYVGDQVPTVDCWDFYFWNDDGKRSGWSRRMILDSWSRPALDGSAQGMRYNRRQGKIYEKPFDNQFLYNPGKRKFASNLHEIITWQFADLSAVAPFRYHSVRGLGYLLYAICHLQNRLYCKFSEAQFEQLMMYFRVKSKEDAARALKVDLVHRGFVDDTIQFIPNNERYQIRSDLVQLGLATNQNIIGRNSASWTANPSSTQDKRDLTATQWMGEANKVTQLVSSALNQAYIYQAVEYREIFRRLCRKNSRDADCRKFQAACLQQGIPEKVLYSEDAWDIEAERIMGAGNKSLELLIARQLMEWRHYFDPEPQRDILRYSTLALTDNAEMTEGLVPRQPEITSSVHDAQLAVAPLMMGMPVSIKSGINRIEYIETMLASLGMAIQKISKRGQIATMDELIGLGNVAAHIRDNVQVLAQDPNETQQVATYNKQLQGLMNLVKRMAQMVEEQMKSQNGGMGQQDREAMAKIQSMKVISDAKAANTRESHAQRTAQRRIQFEHQIQQDAQKAQLELQKMQAESGIKIESLRRKAEIDLVKERLKIRGKVNPNEGG
jgi:hypothetical protein